MQLLTVDIPATSTAIGGVIATVIGSWALLTNARGKNSRPLAVLRRVWDWIEAKGYDTETPPTLKNDVLEVLNDDDAKSK